MNATDLGTVALAIVAVLGLLGAGFAWLYKRGADERELAINLNRVADSADKLSGKMDKLSDTLAAHGEKLADHDARLRAGGL